MNSVAIYNQINKITTTLIKKGLSVEQNFPSNNQGCISYSGMKDVSVAMNNIAYDEIYKKLDEAKNYNAKLIDGALIQMLYNFDQNKLVSHRLAFFRLPT